MTDKEKEEFEPITQRTDREIVQSYSFTFSKQNLNVWEKRILYHIIYDTKVQEYVREKIAEGKKKNDKMVLFTGTTSYKIPLSRISTDSGDYKRIKAAFSELAKKGFEYTDDKGVWKQRSFIAFPTIDPYEGCAYFVVHNDLIDIIGDIARGYRQFDFFIAISLESSNAMRLYEMFSRQDGQGQKDTTGGYIRRDINELKELLGLSGKYEKPIMFVKRVLEPAKKELDEKANYSFDYKLEKSFGSRKTDIIQFHVYHKPENERNNEELTSNKEKALLNDVGRISPKLWKALIDMGFSEHEIKSNQYTLYIAESYTFYNRANGNTAKATEYLLKEIDRLKEQSLKKDRQFKPYIMKTLQYICEIDYKEETDENKKAEKIKTFAEKVALSKGARRQSTQENKAAEQPKSSTEDEETEGEDLPFGGNLTDKSMADILEANTQESEPQTGDLNNIKNILADKFNAKK